MKKILGLLMILGVMASFGGCGKDGLTRSVEYYENGQVEVEGNRKDGERDGKWVWYGENGQIEAEGSYENGYKIGKWVYYYADGQLMSEEYYDDEYIALRRCVDYDEDGKIVKDLEYNLDETAGPFGGPWNGKFVDYHKNGQIRSEGNYEDGERVGKWVVYEENGQIIAEGEYKKDGETGREWNGKFIEYYYNGQMRWEWNYKNGETVSSFHYFENGQLKYEGNYKDGKRVGKWVKYDSEGNITDEDIFENGECVDMCEGIGTYEF